MKNLLLLFACALLFASLVLAQKIPVQQPDLKSDTYQLGSKTVRIPAPEGFTEISSRFDRVAGRLIATEDPGNEMIAIHVPESFISKLQISEDIDLEFYTKVSVNKKAKTLDLTPEIFASVVSTLEKNFSSYLDPNGPVLKRVESNSSKGLSELWGNETSVNIGESKNLGFIEKSDNVFSGMMLMNVEVYGRKLAILGTMSLLRINKRLVFVYAYKMTPGKEDVRILQDFTKNWTAAIIAANK